MMRIYAVNGVEMYKCHNCGKLFPFDRRFKMAVCAPCIEALKQPEQSPTEMLIDKFRNLNADYIESIQENLRDRRTKANQIRRAREAAVLSEFTYEDWQHCKKYFGYRCAYCGERKRLSQDHVVPLSKGGPYTRDNIIPACKPCNSSKHDDDDFRLWFRRKAFYAPEREAIIVEYLAMMASSD